MTTSARKITTKTQSTARRLHLLATYERLYVEHCRPPTYNELQAATGLTRGATITLALKWGVQQGRLIEMTVVTPKAKHSTFVPAWAPTVLRDAMRRNAVRGGE